MGGGADGGDEGEFCFLGEGKGFKASVVSVAGITLQRKNISLIQPAF